MARLHPTQVVQTIVDDLFREYQAQDNVAFRMEIANQIHKFLSLEIKSEPKGGFSEQDWQSFLREVDALPPDSREAIVDALTRLQDGE